MVEHSETRQELLKEANALWKKYGSEYRNLVGDYHRLLKKRREMMKTGQMKKMPLGTIKKSALSEYRPIKFLDYVSETEAMAFIKSLDDKEIMCVIKDIKDFNESALTQTLRAKVFDFDYQIRHCNTEKSIYALDPGACKGNGRHSHRTQLSYTGGLNVSDK